MTDSYKTEKVLQQIDAYIVVCTFNKWMTTDFEQTKEKKIHTWYVVVVVTTSMYSTWLLSRNKRLKLN